MAANNMKKYRTQRGFSMAELSFETHISERYLYFIEKGEKNPSMKTAQTIAKALGKSIDDIFFKHE